MTCLGCQLANNKIQTFQILENSFFNVILDINPLKNGHLLILPKRHIEGIEKMTSIALFAL